MSKNVRLDLGRNVKMPFRPKKVNTERKVILRRQPIHSENNSKNKKTMLEMESRLLHLENENKQLKERVKFLEQKYTSIRVTIKGDPGTPEFGTMNSDINFDQPYYTKNLPY